MEQDLPAPESVSSSLEDLIPSLAEHFATHPGFMWQAVGFEGLHADWPAYPLGHGVHAVHLLT